jgi:hypothetical protein
MGFHMFVYRSVAGFVTIICIYDNIYIYINVLGGIPTPLKNMSSSVGMMTFPKKGKHVPNHQPDIQ